MDLTLGSAARAWLARKIDIKTDQLDVVALPGASSSSLYRIACGPGAGDQRLLLRVFDNQAWLAEEPDAAAHEAAALEEARRAGLPAPRLLAVAEPDAGFDAPALLMSYLPGSIDFRPAGVRQWLAGLARQLAAIHQHQAAGFAWRSASWVDRAALAAPVWSRRPQHWEAAIALLAGPAPERPAVFLHRDYHPGNVLWQRGQLSGVVDWASACSGPAALDVGYCRANLALLHGPAAADQFLQRYCEAAPGFAPALYWDVDAVLDLYLPQPGWSPSWDGLALRAIPPGVLQRRADRYLEHLLRQS